MIRRLLLLGATGDLARRFLFAPSDLLELRAPPPGGGLAPKPTSSSTSSPA